MRDASVDAAWTLGVLCTEDDQVRLLRELRRIVRRGGRIALLVLVATTDPLPERPEGNTFPTADLLAAAVESADLRVIEQCAADHVGKADEKWTRRDERIEAELERRHRTAPAWLTAQRQSAVLGRLLASGDLSTELLALEH